MILTLIVVIFGASVTHLRPPVASELHRHESGGSFLTGAGVAALPEKIRSPLSPRTSSAQLPRFLPLPHWKNRAQKTFCLFGSGFQ